MSSSSVKILTSNSGILQKTQITKPMTIPTKKEDTIFSQKDTSFTDLSNESFSPINFSPDTMSLSKSFGKESLMLSQEGHDLVKKTKRLIERAKIMAEESQIMSEDFDTLAKDYAILSKKKSLLMKKCSTLKTQLETDIEEINETLYDEMTKIEESEVNRSIKSIVKKDIIFELTVFLLTGKSIKIEMNMMKEMLTYDDFIYMIIEKFKKENIDCYFQLSIENIIEVISDGKKYNKTNMPKLTDEFLLEIYTNKKIHIIVNAPTF